jgi:hypothetical protein
LQGPSQAGLAYRKMMEEVMGQGVACSRFARVQGELSWKFAMDDCEDGRVGLTLAERGRGWIESGKEEEEVGAG